MNKLIKYIIIVFISFNVLGGVVLGTREYIEEQEAKQAFENFYKSDTQVMGAYDKKASYNQSLYIIGGSFLLTVPLIMGATGAHFVIKKKQRKIKQKEQVLEVQTTEASVPKRIIHL
ncbi:MAG: hypothetical protein AAB632_03460 [Patescibacteria group bacterium]